MGSSMKPVIFGDNVASAIKTWHRAAKQRVKHGHGSEHATPFNSRPATPLHGMSPVHLLSDFQQHAVDRADSDDEGWANSVAGTSVPTPRRNLGQERGSRSTMEQSNNGDHQHEIEIGNSNEFSFVNKKN